MKFEIVNKHYPVAQTEWMEFENVEFQIKAISNRFCIYWRITDKILNWLLSKVSEIEDANEVKSYINCILEMHGGCTYWNNKEKVIGCDYNLSSDRPISNDEYRSIFGEYQTNKMFLMLDVGYVEQTYDSVLNDAKMVCKQINEFIG